MNRHEKYTSDANAAIANGREPPNPPPRYAVPTGGSKYSPEETARILEIVLPLMTRAAYETAANSIANRTARGHRVDHHGRTNSQFLDRFLWGLATRYHEHVETPRVSRTVRQGPLSYVETKIIKTAANSNSEEAAAARHKRGVGPPDAAYLARLLCRSEATCAAALRRLGPARGRHGLLGD